MVLAMMATQILAAAPLPYCHCAAKKSAKKSAEICRSTLIFRTCCKMEEGGMSDICFGQMSDRKGWDVRPLHNGCTISSSAKKVTDISLKAPAMEIIVQQLMLPARNMQ
jgi:hypothetical protein